MQDIQIPKLPNFCSHCHVVGHIVTECRTQKKKAVQENETNSAMPVQQKNVWRVKTSKRIPIGTDICQTPEISDKRIETEIIDDEIVDTIIPTVSNTVEQSANSHHSNSGKFHALQDSDIDIFPLISVDKILDIASSSSSVLRVVNIIGDKEEGTKEVIKKVDKPKPISVSLQQEDKAQNLVKEKKEMRSPVSSQTSKSK